MDSTQSTALEGNRKFAWFKSAKSSPSDYESYTLGQQSSPSRLLHVGWPLRTDEGGEPFSESSTAICCLAWEGHRDPSQLWQRPYVASINHEQQTLAKLLDSVLTAEVVRGMNPSWVKNVLGKYLAAWPFVEYGQFLALCYVVREALAETLTFAYAFEAADKMRYSQNIVMAILEFEEKASGYSDSAARPAWESDPVLVPLREVLEQICASKDWVEIVVAIDLVLEPLIGTLVKQEFFSLNAAYNGDPVTPLLLASERADAKRHLDSAVALARHAIADTQHGSANRRQLLAWGDKWSTKVGGAAQALQGLFRIDGITVRQPFEASLKRATQVQQAAWAALGN